MGTEPLDFQCLLLPPSLQPLMVTAHLGDAVSFAIFGNPCLAYPRLVCGLGSKGGEEWGCGVWGGEERENASGFGWASSVRKTIPQLVCETMFMSVKPLEKVTG